MEEISLEIALTTRIERANKAVCISLGIARSRYSLRDLRIADSAFLLPLYLHNNSRKVKILHDSLPFPWAKVPHLPVIAIVS